MHATARTTLAAILLATAAASAQTTYAPYVSNAQPQQTVVSNGLSSLAYSPAGTPLLVRQRASNLPIQCTLVWVTDRNFACNTYATSTVPAQQLVFQAAELDSVRILGTTHAAPAAPLIEPPINAYAPPPQPRYVQPAPVYVVPDHHHMGAIVALTTVTGALLGGLIGQNFSTSGGFVGAALGGIGGAGIGLAATETYDHYQYPPRPAYRSYP